MTVEAVIFDWGGTLTPWHDIDLVDMWRAYAIAFGASDPDSLAQSLARAETMRWDIQRSSRGADGTGALDQLFESVGIDISTARHGRALAAYLSHWEPHTLADADAIEVMVGLRSRGIRVGVLSNTMWPRWHHEAVFSRDGLLPLIDAAVYSSELPVAKPHADAFRVALAAVSSPPHTTVFVGDRPWDDVHGAQEVGMRAILVPHSRLGDQAVPVDVTPDAVVSRLGEVLVIVDAWREA